MSCEEVKALLDEYICGELDEKKNKLIKAHLDTCDDCRAEYEQLKSLKAEIGNLKQSVPADFNEVLLRRIRRKRRLTYINGISAGIAAAVVLVCVIGIGYGSGYNSGLEDKMRAMGGFETTTRDRVPETVESTSEMAVTKQDDVTEESTVQEESAEIVTVQKEDTKSATRAVESVEVVTEQVAELVTESVITTAQTAVNMESVQIETATETESAYEDSPVAAAKSGRSLIPYDYTEGREEGSDETSDTQTALAESAPAVASVQSTDETLPHREADVNLVVIGTDVDTLISVLYDVDDISDVKAEANVITARVYNMSYEDFKELLYGFNVEEEEVYMEENSLDYSIRISVE